MTSYPVDLLRRYVPRGVLLDSNILLLLFVGSYDRGRISSFKRTNQFVPEDFDLLAGLIPKFRAVATTPNILTEVSNLALELAEPARLQAFELFASKIALLREHYQRSTDVAATPEFARFGLTDAAIAGFVKGRYLVLTEDFRLSQYLAHKQIDVLNFNHIRTLAWS